MSREMEIQVGDLVRVYCPNGIGGSFSAPDVYHNMIGLCIKKRMKVEGQNPTATILIGEEKVGFYLNELVKYVES